MSLIKNSALWDVKNRKNIIIVFILLLLIVIVEGVLITFLINSINEQKSIIHCDNIKSSTEQEESSQDEEKEEPTSQEAESTDNSTASTESSTTPVYTPRNDNPQNNPTPTPTPSPQPEPVAPVYTVGISRVDKFSPDGVVSVYKDGVAIPYSSIKFADGGTMCTSGNPTVSLVELDGVGAVQVVLSDGSVVSAGVSY